MKCLLKFWVFLIFFSSSTSVASAQEVDPFRWDFDNQSRTLQPGGSVSLEVTFRIPPKHFLYKDKIDLHLLEGEGFTLGPLEFSPALQKRDPFFGGEKEVFEVGALMKSILRADPHQPEGKKLIKLQLTYQGCSDALCYRLMKKELILPVEIQKGPEPALIFSSRGSNPFRDRNLFLSILFAFLGGLLSDFTPCVLPIIPITLAFIGVRKSGASLRRNFVLSLFFAASIAFTFALLGLAAASVGKTLGFLFQSLYFLLFVSALYLLFSLSLLGLFEIQVPLSIRNLISRWGGEGIAGAIISGFTVGFLAAPCIGPLIASLLLYVAQERSLPKGFVLLYFYGLGMGSLFMVVGTFYHRLAAKIHGGPFTVWIKRAFAILLLIPAFYYGSIAWGHLRRSHAVPTSGGFFWVTDVGEGFEKAAAQEKPIFLDFYASWCLPCVEMETRSFSDPSLQRLLLERFVPIKVNCTDETPQCQQMVERYSIIGWPTFLILSPQGEVLETLIGKSLSAEQLKDILDKTLNHYSE